MSLQLAGVVDGLVHMELSFFGKITHHRT